MHVSAFLLLGLSTGSPFASSMTDVKAEVMRTIESQSIESHDKAVMIPSFYLGKVRPMQQRKRDLSDDDLHRLFTVTGAAFFYAQFSDFENRKTILDDLTADLAELERRRLATVPEVSELYQGLVSMRDLNEAKALRRSHPGASLPEVPPVTRAADFDARLPGVYGLAPDGKSLHLHNIDAAHGKLVVVVAQCHFARDAAAAIVSDPELFDAFKKGNVVWIQSASEPLSAGDLKTWNDLFPDFLLSTSFDDKNWPDIDFSRSPGFFFFDGGKLVSRQDGWSTANSKSALTESLRRLGFLGPQG